MKSNAGAIMTLAEGAAQVVSTKLKNKYKEFNRG
jgi:hypothetical protein